MGKVHNITIAWSEDFECFEDVRWFLDGETGRTGSSLYMILRKRVRNGVPSYRIVKIGSYSPSALSSLAKLDEELEVIRLDQKGRGKIVVRHGSPCRDDQSRASSVEISCLPRALITGIRPQYNTVADSGRGRKLHFNITNIGMYLPLKKRIDTAERGRPYVFTLSKKDIGSIQDEIADHVKLLRHDWWYSNEAFNMAHRALELAESAFGGDNIKLVWYLKKLAFIYVQQKRFGDAERLYRRALKILEDSGLADSPNAYDVLCNLGGVLLCQGCVAEAEACETRALDLAMALYGPDGPDSARTMLNLANIYGVRDRFDEAEGLYEKGMAVLEGSPSVRPADIQRGLRNMARLYEDNVEYDQAAECLRRALALKADRLGPSDPGVLRDVMYFGRRLEHWEEPEEAEHLYMSWIRDLEKSGYGESGNTAQLYCRLAELYLSRDMHTMAELTCARAIETARNVKGSGGQYLEVEALVVQSRIFAVRQKYRESLDALERARENAFGTGLAERVQEEIIWFHVHQAQDFGDSGDLEDAKSCCLRAVHEMNGAMREKLRLDNWYVMFTSVLDDLADICKRMKEPALAKQLMKLSRKLWKRTPRDTGPEAIKFLDEVLTLLEGQSTRPLSKEKKTTRDVVIRCESCKPVFPGILPGLPEHTESILHIKHETQRSTRTIIEDKGQVPRTVDVVNRSKDNRLITTGADPPSPEKE